ncbi:MAG: hypothetical protein H8K04_02700 [Nitrospira sp.]
MITLTVTSCIYPAFTKATGSLNQMITFRFFQSPDDEKPSKFDILDVTLQERSIDAQWVTIWDLNGKACLSEVVYGSKYQGLNEIIPAKPLKQHGKYRLLISGTTWPKPGLGEAGIDFFFDEEGKLIQSGTRVRTPEQ